MILIKPKSNKRTLYFEYDDGNSFDFRKKVTTRTLLLTNFSFINKNSDTHRPKSYELLLSITKKC